MMHICAIPTSQLQKQFPRLGSGATSESLRQGVCQYRPEDVLLCCVRLDAQDALLDVQFPQGQRGPRFLRIVRDFRLAFGRCYRFLLFPHNDLALRHSLFRAIRFRRWHGFTSAFSVFGDFGR